MWRDEPDGVRDPDHDLLSWELPLGPAGMEIDPITDLLAWMPTDFQIGTQNVLVPRISEPSQNELDPPAPCVSIRRLPNPAKPAIFRA